MNASSNCSKYSVQDFMDIMHKLRGPNGCEWDKEQTHLSIRREFLEECYEAVEAIDSGNTELLREELGDVLLQVVFHSAIEEEKGSFDFFDVVDDIAKKMVVRHPHVFGDVKVGSVDDILTNWDTIKKETKGQRSDKEMLQSVTKVMPALMRSQKLQKKAAKLGVDLSKKVLPESGEAVTEAYIGVLLAEAVKLAADNGIDAEQALYRECDKFIEENF